MQSVRSAIVWQSSGEMVKLKTSVFCLILSGFTDLGSGSQPFCMLQRMHSCAGVVLYFSERLIISGTLKICPVPRGLYASRRIPCCLQKATSSG